jgi:hypothetical protein
MDYALTDDLDIRLRAARPAAAVHDPDALDADLLALVRRQPVKRRSIPRVRATPVVVAAAAVAAVVAVTFGGGPASVGGPDTASAVTAALQWFAPPAGTVLHAKSTETIGDSTVTREFWQSADHPELSHLVVDAGAGQSYERAAEQLYDPQTNTIYEGGKAAAVKPAGTSARDAAKAAAIEADKVAGQADQATVDAQEAAARAAKNAAGPDAAAAKVGAAPSQPDPGTTRVHPEDLLPPGDPVVSKIRFVLQDGHARVTGHEMHNGVDAWVISLNPGLERAAWTLWVDRADGRPLELYDPGRTATSEPQMIRWTSYEVVRDATVPTSLEQLHPTAVVVRDSDQFAAAEDRLVR